MLAFFQKTVRILLMLMILVVIAGGAGGYFMPSPEIALRNSAVNASKQKLAAVKDQFESSHYRRLIATISQIGSAEQFESEVRKLGADDYPFDGDWKTTMGRLYGEDELNLFLSQGGNGETGETGEENAAKDNVTFPNIRLTGVTFSNGGTKAVSVLNVNGTTEIWLWKKTAEGWTTDSITPGFGLKEVKIDRDNIEFRMFSIEHLQSSKDYLLSTSLGEELQKYKMQ